MYVNNTNILLLIDNVYNYDYSFGENKTKRTLIVKLKETHFTQLSFLNSEGFSILDSCINICMLGFLR